MLSGWQNMPEIWNKNGLFQFEKQFVIIITNARTRDPVYHIFDDMKIIKF